MSFTVQQKNNRDGVVKAGELIEVRSAHALTLQDGRIFNALIENSWDSINWEKIENNPRFTIPIYKLRGYRYKGSERVRDSVARLIKTSVKVPWTDRRGNPALLETTLLGGAIMSLAEDDPHAELSYSFAPELLMVIKNSRYWARLHPLILFNISSKYALRLYESVSLRLNLRVDHQDFSVGDFRELLGVEPAKLTSYSNFRLRAIDPAVLEVNGLSDAVVTVTDLRSGGAVRGKLTGFRLHWRRKTEKEKRVSSYELLQSRLGRKTRLSEQVEHLEFYQPREG